MLDGRGSTVGELARASHVALSTASEHLARLQSAGLVLVHAQGRHRYYRLAGPEVAGLLETMDTLPVPGSTADAAGTGRPDSTSAGALPRSRTPAELRFARTCYDHLAGGLAVALHDLLIVGEDDGTPELAPTAPAALAMLGVDDSPAGRQPPSPATELPGLVGAQTAPGRRNRRCAALLPAGTWLAGPPQDAARGSADHGGPRPAHRRARPASLLGAAAQPAGAAPLTGAAVIPARRAAAQARAGSRSSAAAAAGGRCR